MKITEKLISRTTAVLMASALVMVSLAGCGGSTGSQETTAEASSESLENTSAATITDEANAGSEAADSKDTDDTDAGKTAYVSPSYAKKVSLADDGTLSIERAERSGEDSGCAEDTWTILVYMCGSDLESGYGCATGDIAEMVDAETSENVKFIVQSGGANEWQNDVMDASKFQRYEIHDGDFIQVDEQPISDMGDGQSLADFLYWGISSYPAEHTALVLWNHGGGSISGVCFDERYDYNSLTLKDIDNALFSVFDLMGHNFEFVGFDACLMGTVETANVLASYADYMYGSQEIEPGTGWDYTALGKYINEHPTSDGGQIGKIFADDYYSYCDEIECGDAATMSVIDLTKLDDFTVAFNTFTYNLYASTENAENLAGMERNVLKVDNFGGNNKSVGYTNMVDLKGLIEAGRDYADGADAALKALEDVIVYSRSGIDHSAAGGLSVYYPLEVQGSDELGTFGEVAISPYYLAYVDRTAYGAMQAGNTSDYDYSTVIDMWTTANNEGSVTGYDTYWNNYEGYEQTGQSSLITFASAPAIDESGSYGFTLTPEALMNTSDVQALVYELSDDGNDLIELGYSTDINAEVKDDIYVTVSDDFDGYWFSLPDGQNLAVYVLTQGDDYNVFSSPISLNGEATNLIFTYDYTKGKITIEGTWDGIDDNGMASRDYKELKAGDKIKPLYDAYSVDTDELTTYEGTEYIYKADTTISYGLMLDGDYYYCFIIYDVYGDYYQTDYVSFNIENGEPYYYVQN